MGTFTLGTSTLSGPGEAESRQRLMNFGKWVQIRLEQVPEDKDLKILGLTLYWEPAGERRGT